MRGSPIAGIFFAIMQRSGTVGLAPAPGQYGTRVRWAILSTYLRDNLFSRLLQKAELIKKGLAGEANLSLASAPQIAA